MAAEIVSACAGGGVLTGYALFLGCNATLAAAIGSLPVLSQVVQLPSAWLTHLHGSRRVTLVAVAVSRQALLPLTLLPFLRLSPDARRVALLAVASVNAIIGVAGNNAWTAWIGALVPESQRGRFFARRTSFAMLSGAVGALAAGLLMDTAGKAGYTAVVLAGLSITACLAGAVTSVLLVRHQAPPDHGAEEMTLRHALTPLKDRRARPFLAYQVMWNGAVGLSASYVSVFMLKSLHLSFTVVAACGAASLLVRAATLPIWGRVIDRLGARPVLIVCSFGLFGLPLVWLAPRADAVWLLGDVVLAAALWAGHGLASFQLPLSLAPEKNRPFYLATFGSAGGLAFALAAFAGAWLATALPSRLHVLGGSLESVQVLFILSSIGRLMAAPLSLQVVEEGSGPVSEFFAHVCEAIGDQARAFAARA